MIEIADRQASKNGFVSVGFKGANIKDWKSKVDKVPIKSGNIRKYSEIKRVPTSRDEKMIEIHYWDLFGISDKFRISKKKNNKNKNQSHRD